ncbi:MAG: hypothetical protein ACD_40C00323G0006 [uncultured bacterium]|nr:MAG: hypothetical protein ACD_40C00323G0006 [uncultured bacterium]
MKPTPYRTIDTAGQVTAVITQAIEPDQLGPTSREIMAKNPTIEQVGYLNGNQFTMMGGELSINGLIAASYLLNQSGTVNGYPFIVKQSQISLTLPISIVLETSNNIIQLQGIAYQITPELRTTQKIPPSTRKWLQKLSSDSRASGLIYYSRNKIQPLVYVPTTNTYVWENACGSGSLAFSLATGIRRILQPSGQIIRFSITKKNITVTAAVKEV